LRSAARPRLASALAASDVGAADRAAALGANSHVMLELLNGVPARDPVLVSIDIRLSRSEMRYIIEHSRARLLIATIEFADAAGWLAEEIGVRMIVSGTGGRERTTVDGGVAYRRVAVPSIHPGDHDAGAPGLASAPIASARSEDARVVPARCVVEREPLSCCE
jgi:acyl-CoA synthetase (AMP-forming)/AMP-acid ligase II